MYHVHTHTQQCPSYVSDMVMLVNSDLFHRQLHSADSLVCAVRRTWTRFADIAFTVARPVVWNSLLASVKSPPYVIQFRKRRKTYLFHCNTMMMCDIASYCLVRGLSLFLRPSFIDCGNAWQVWLCVCNVMMLCCVLCVQFWDVVWRCVSRVGWQCSWTVDSRGAAQAHSLNASSGLLVLNCYRRCFGLVVASPAWIVVITASRSTCWPVTFVITSSMSLCLFLFSFKFCIIFITVFVLYFLEHRPYIVAIS